LLAVGAQTVDGGGERASGGRLIDRQRAQNMPLPHRCGRPPCKAQSARNRVRLAGWLAASSEGATVRANRLAVGQRGRSGRPAGQPSALLEARFWLPITL